jgi:hypothetical protein
MQVIARRAARWLLASLLFTYPGCQLLKPSGPSQVAQGRYYSTGNPDYDEFFVELHRLQVELKDAPEHVAEPRAALAKSLETGLDADEIKAALTKKTTELAKNQIKLTIVRPTNPEKPLSLRVTGTPTGPDAELQKLLDQTLTKVSELKLVIGGWQKLLDELPGREVALEGSVNAAFVGTSPGTRADIKNNLSDGQKIIGILVGRAKDAERSNTELLDALTASLGETSSNDKASEASSPAPDSATPAEKKSPKKSAPPPSPTKPARPAHEQKAAPAPKPAPAPQKPAPAPQKPAPAPQKPAPAAKPEHSEVPPAPKPTQGTAKPDFEP